MSDFPTWVTQRRRQAAAAMAELSGNASARDWDAYTAGGREALEEAVETAERLR